MALWQMASHYCASLLQLICGQNESITPNNFSEFLLQILQQMVRCIDQLEWQLHV